MSISATAEGSFIAEFWQSFNETKEIQNKKDEMRQVERESMATGGPAPEMHVLEIKHDPIKWDILN